MAKKIVFMGTPMFAVPILNSLYQNGYPISEVYTQPPQKSHRGQRINKSPIQGIAETLNLEFRTPKSLKNNNEEFEYFKKIDADLAIVVAYGQIIPKEFLTLTKKGFINIHASILPNWRGAAPIQRSIMNLDKETGFSIMKIEEQLDSGPVSNIYKINLENNLNAPDVAQKLSSLAAEKISNNIDDILEDRAKFIEQDHLKATYASKVEKVEGKIDWNDNAQLINQKIRALNPNPGAWFEMDSKRIKVMSSKVIEMSGNAGEILNDEFIIACGENALQPTTLKKEGKGLVTLAEFLKGNKVATGTKL